MRAIATLLLMILMPVALIGGGFLLFDYGVGNDHDLLGWIGMGMMAVGIVWGIILFLVVQLRSW